MSEVPRSGRPSATSRADLERVALRLFTDRGFDATTVDDVAEAAGIGRRTFFRYFASKNDVVWGEFGEGLTRLRAHLAHVDPGDARPLLDVLREAVLAFNALDPQEVPRHRERMTLILGVPALQAHSTLLYTAWRTEVARFVAARTGDDADGVLPQVVAHACLGAALTAYEHWLQDPDADLQALLGSALEVLAGGWSGR